MKISSCLLIGAGGTGSFLAEALLKLMWYHENGTRLFRIADGDILEEKNLNRQRYRADQVGKNKARALAETLSLTYPSISVFPYVVNEKTISSALANLLAPILIVSAVDNDASRALIIKYLESVSFKDYILLSPGNSTTRATLFFHSPIKELASPSPLLRYKNLQNPKDSIPESCGAIIVSNPQVISANFQAASQVILAVSNLLEDKVVPLDMSMDLSSLEFSVNKLIKPPVLC